MTQFLRNCSVERYILNKSRMVRLAEYSRDCLRTLRHDTGIQYEARSRGTLQVFRTQKQLDAEAKDIAVLSQMGVPFQHMDPAGCVQIEPALGEVQGQLLGGLYLPGDETGDCQLFTTHLAAMAETLGVQFRQTPHSSAWSHNTAGSSGWKCKVPPVLKPSWQTIMWWRLAATRVN